VGGVTEFRPASRISTATGVSKVFDGWFGGHLFAGTGRRCSSRRILSGITSQLGPVISLANLSSLIAGFVAWFATIWFYRAHRNLVILGETRSRFRSTALIWRLVVPGVNFVASAPVIREILTKPDGQGAFMHFVWAWAWSWPLLNLGQWIHSAITNLHLELAHARQWRCSNSRSILCRRPRRRW